MQEKSSLLEQRVLKQGRNIHDSMCSCTFYYEINHLDLLKKTKTGDLHPIVFCNRLRSKQATDAVAFSLFPSIRYEIHFY